MTWDTVQQMVRTAMQFIGGYLVSKGVIDEAGLTALVGAGVSVSAFVWWWVWERKREDAVV